MSKLSTMGSMFYTALLFAPLGFWILGTIFALKAMKTRDLAQFKNEIKNMFYQTKKN